MRNGDKVTITKPGILNGQTGTITEIRYKVKINDCGDFYMSDGEILPEKKDNASNAIKTLPTTEPTVKQVKPKKAEKEVKQKRAYVRKAK